MKNIILSILVSLLLVACASGSSSEDDGTTEADLKKNAGPYACSPEKTTKHPTYPEGLALSLAPPMLEPSGADPIPLAPAPPAATTKYPGYDRYAVGQNELVLVKRLANGDVALHLARPFVAEDYLCKPRP